LASLLHVGKINVRSVVRVYLPDTGSVSIRYLRGFHKGETVWLLGSGKSLDFVPRNFFNDKIVVGVNATCNDWPVDYAFAHHYEDAQHALDHGLIVVASQYDQGRAENGMNELKNGAWFQYKHPWQPKTLVMDMGPMERDDPDALVIGSNTVTSAMDFAGRILEASTLVLCGVDGGSIDGQWNYKGYNDDGTMAWPDPDRSAPGGTAIPHVRAQAPLIAQVITGLTRRGVAVFSLRLDGHEFAQ